MNTWQPVIIIKLWDEHLQVKGSNRTGTLKESEEFYEANASLCKNLKSRLLDTPNHFSASK